MDKYVIVTPAYNEAEYIEQTIESVISQTTLPDLWVIVDDGSMDNTAEIIRRYAKEYDWIRYLRREKVSGQTYYASNVYAVDEGIMNAKGFEYKYLAILDADISLPKDYYEQIFMRFKGDERLGIASGVYLIREGERLKKVLNDRRSCPKNIMVFRQECFEQIGGFVPMKYGGEDTCSCVMARMNGWKSWSFPEVCVVHNKPVGTGHSRGLLKIRFRHGVGEYFMATHPLFMLVKSLRRCIKEKPVIIGGLARMAGFLYGYCLREKRQIPDDMVRFIHQEHIIRLFNMNQIPKEHRVDSHNAKVMKLCLVASSGGHLSQLLKLSESWDGYETIYVTTTEVMRKDLSQHGRVYVVGESNHQHPWKVFRVLICCFKIILREKPDIIISTGAAAGCMVCFLGKLFGAKVVWIDSITNVERLSLSGRMIRRIADLFLTQWPELAEKYKNVEYVGAVI